jgi:hypothetical protein
MLQLSLEHLFKCPEAKDAKVVVYADNHPHWPTHPDIFAVARRFPVKLVKREADAGFYAIRNKLEALRDAYNDGADLIYDIEEDVLVGQDLFRWHRAIFAQEPDIFASIGRKRAAAHFPNPKPEDYELVRGFNCGGSAFPRRSIPLLLDHATRKYYDSPYDYLAEAFPEFVPGMGKSNSGYDGMVLRVILRQGSYCAWPVISRAQHIGIYGMHRRYWELRGDMSTEHMLVILRERIRDELWMCQHFKDCEVFDLEDKVWDKPVRIATDAP